MATDMLQKDQIFNTAAEIHDPAARSAYLDEVCRGNEDLRREIDELLAHDEQANHFLELPVLPVAIDDQLPLNEPLVERPNSVIGPYRLMEQIGEGGFGVVFMAMQERPVRRKVAIKIIKPGMDTRQVIARFEAERQALAMMDHPSIAKVFDAGATETGRPYFVMELIQGVPITEYCDQCNLTTRQRLELFITVCQAVQHAHQKGVIHRDIKPTNVLVAWGLAPFAESAEQKVPVPLPREKPLVKIIDFGVAKAVGQRLTEHTLTTAFAQMVGSPLYMSPEQAELSPLGVDTRSDIYSLGVLLYELLTGTTPFDKERIHAAPYDELRRIIREEEPPRPSARLSSLSLRERAGVRARSSEPSRTSSGSLPLAGRDGEGEIAAETAAHATTIAQHRRTDPRRLVQTVRGELDWIVMKCLDKDRNRRYPTANSLASDVGRYLANKPVEASPPSAAYRCRLFVRRNKAAMFTAAVVAASLVMSTIISLWQASQARRAELLAEQRLDAEIEARRQATSTTDLLRQMLHTASPAAAKGAGYTVRQMLDDFSKRLDSQLSDQPAVEATIRATIGQAYWYMEQHDRAEPHLKAALELRRRAFGPVSAEAADSLIDYAWCVGRVDHVRMEKLAHEALAILRSLNVPADRTIRPLAALAFSIDGNDRALEWRECVEQILAIQSENPRDQSEVARVLHWMSDRECALGNYRDAERLARESLIRHRKFDGEHHPETAWGLNALAAAVQGRDKLEEAEELYQQALQILRHHYAEHHHPIVHVSKNLLPLAMAKGDQATIDRIRRSAESAVEHENSNSHELYDCANIFVPLKMWRQSEQCFARTAELHPDYMLARYYVALLRLHRHDIEGYRATCQAALARGERLPTAYAQYLAAWSSLLGPESDIDFERVIKLADRARELDPNSSHYRQAAAIARYRAGQFQEAHDLLLACIKADAADDSKRLVELYSRLFLAMAQQRLNRLSDAQQTLQEASAGVDELLENSDMAWDYQLTLKLWREEAEQLVLAGDSEKQDGSKSRDTPDKQVPSA